MFWSIDTAAKRVRNVVKPAIRYDKNGNYFKTRIETCEASGSSVATGPLESPWKRRQTQKRKCEDCFQITQQAKQAEGQCNFTPLSKASLIYSKGTEVENGRCHRILRNDGEGSFILSSQPSSAFSAFLWWLWGWVEGCPELGAQKCAGCWNLCKEHWDKDCPSCEIFVLQFIQWIFLKIKKFSFTKCCFTGICKSISCYICILYTIYNR